MPNPSAPTAYPSSTTYPSGPNQQPSQAAGQVKFSGQAGAPSVSRRVSASGAVTFTGQSAGVNALIGAPVTDAAITFSGSADATAQRFLYASGFPTFTADPVYLAAAGAATGTVTFTGTATSNVQVPTLTASGSFTPSSSANAIALPATNAIITQPFTGSATANTASSAGVAAVGSFAVSVSVTANVVWQTAASGFLDVGGDADGTVLRPAAASGSFGTFGQAAATRLIDATATPGSIILIGAAVQGGGTSATATGSIGFTSSATASTIYGSTATGTLRTSAVTTIVRTAFGSFATSAAVAANRGHASQAAGAFRIVANVDGRTVIDVDSTANSITFSGVVGGVIGTPASAAGTFVTSAAANSIVFTPVFAKPAGPVKPQSDIPRLRLLVAQTTTGRVAFDLPFTNLSWNAPLNKIGQCSATLPLEEVLDAAYAQGATSPRSTIREILLGPYKFSLVVCYGNVAVFGGPLLPTEDEDESTIKIAGVGMERLLESRLIVNRAPGDATLSDPTRDVTIRSANPAGAVVQAVTSALTTYDASRPRGLPITCLNPPNGRGDEDFTWLSYDLTSSWKAISDLTSRVDGPDVRLEPSLRQGSDAFYVSWDLQVGAPTFDVAPGAVGDAEPLPWVWDDQTSKISRSTDALGLATDYFATGAGQDRSKKIAVAGSDDLVKLDFPPLERVDTGSASTEDERALQARVDGLQSAHTTPTDSWKLSVRGDGDPPLGAFKRGDLAKIEVRRKLLIESGDYLRRITEISGTEDPSWVSVTCDHEDDLATV